MSRCSMPLLLEGFPIGVLPCPVHGAGGMDGDSVVEARPSEGENSTWMKDHSGHRQGLTVFGKERGGEGDARI